MGVYNMSAIGDGGPGGGEIRLGTEATEGSSTASKASDIKSAMESKHIDAKVSKSFERKNPAIAKNHLATTGDTKKNITGTRLISLLNVNHPDLAQAAMKSEKVFNAIIGTLQGSDGYLSIDKLHMLVAPNQTLPEGLQEIKSAIDTLKVLTELKKEIPRKTFRSSKSPEHIDRARLDQCMKALDKAIESGNSDVIKIAMTNAKGPIAKIQIKK